MKKNLLVVAALTALAAAPAFAEDGKVNFKGIVIDSPCDVDEASRKIEVDFGKISTATLKKDGRSDPKNFEIKLNNCVFEKKVSDTKTDKVNIYFTYVEPDAAKNLVRLDNSANVDKIGIELTDFNNDIIEPNKRVPVTYAAGATTTTLSFKSQVLAFDQAVEGEFTASASWSLEYK